MDKYESLNHTAWDCKYHVVFIPKCRRRTLYYSNKSIFAKIRIGDNVFIGISSIILPGTNVGSNSIVAAGSVVKGDFPSNVVLGGQPAKVICTTNDYYKNNIDNILNFGTDQARKSQVLSHFMKFAK